LKTSNWANGKDAVYSLPWYVVAGTPKAGKSSLVLGSNLNFQTLPSQRQSEQKFVRPTGNIDWRVTSDAVFVDTAGRYQTEGVDGEEWSAMLETIKKYRSNRPLDGFLMVVNAEKILNSDSRKSRKWRKFCARGSTTRWRALKVRFPVYLIFTHADAIEGFRDSFSTSKNEGKTLVWGATIPLEKAKARADVRRRIRDSAQFGDEAPIDALSRAVSAGSSIANFQLPASFRFGAPQVGRVRFDAFPSESVQRKSVFARFLFYRRADKRAQRTSGQYAANRRHEFFHRKTFPRCRFAR
jgi:type VI protein secretion system component VasK